MVEFIVENGKLPEPLHWTMSPEKLEDAKKIFVELDLNQDGLITGRNLARSYCNHSRGRSNQIFHKIQNRI
jgi:hypothetical protein